MKKQNNEVLFYIIIISIFFLFSGLFLFLMRGRRENDRLYMRFSLEKTVSDILAAAGRGDYDALFSETSGVKGFGVYAPNGTAVTLIGEAPEHIDFHGIEQRGEFFTYDSKARTFTLIRPIGPGRRMDGRGPGGRGNPRHHRFVYIEAYASKYYNYTRSLFTIISILIPLVFLGILIAFTVAYRKNIRYKKQMEEREKLARLGEVSRTLTHEIKNPLGAIRIQSAYLKKIIDKNHISELAVIDQEVERLTVLTDRISDFLRDPVGSPVKIELASFLEKLCVKYSEPVTLEKEAENEIYLYFDYHRLRSIFENVIQNGLESYPDEESDKRVTVSLKRDKLKCVVRISDRGKGLEEDFEERIFDPYYTTKTKGSGIGLAITRRFLEAAGGTIGFERGKAGGTTVQIILKLDSHEREQG